jgi:hypothetical protein
MRFSAFVIAAILAASAQADVITMKNGRVINGTYLGGSPRQVRVEVGDQIETLDVGQIARIEFGSGSYSPPQADNRPVLRRAPSADTPDDRPTLRRDSASSAPDSGPPTLRRQPIMRPDAEPSVSAPPPATNTELVQLAAGTNLTVRMIDGVDSEKNSVGQTFSASVDEPVMLNGQSVIPRGADVVVKLVDAKESGTFTGRAGLTLALISVKVNGKLYDVNTQTVSRESDARGQRTAKTVGAGAALGTIIGAIAGGGKGAAVGAAAGAGAGAGAEVITKGQKVKIPSETRLTFVLDNAITI